MQVLYIQFANSMFKRHDACDAYWDAFYKRWEHIGYYCGKNTFEIPKWIAEISYFCPDGELFWCHNDISEAISKINSADAMGLKYRFGTDYSLFEGEKTIPRLTMSYGCLNRCKFCIVPHGKITPVSDEIIRQQVDSFHKLDYRLIYIDDKTYGQCQNYSMTGDLTKQINDPLFNGFIVQTTSRMLNGDRCRKFVDANVRVAELGLETFNDMILKAYNKPSSEQSVIDAIKNCNDVGILPIVNLIIGLYEETDDTYKRTFDFVMPLLEDEKIIGVNPAIYTDYDNKENLGEIDFVKDEKTEMHYKWWNLFNKTATHILKTNLAKTTNKLN